MHLSIDTVLPADSVEFCPHPEAPNIFVCGTYKLQEEQNLSPTPSSGPANAGQNQIRTGQCLVFEMDSEQEQEQEIISACVPLKLLLSCHGVLELQSMYLQLQNTRDIPRCSLGSKMVRGAFFFPPGKRMARLRPSPQKKSGVIRRQADGR
jgi:hypothetical protein